MTQNIYDDPEFFASYSQLDRQVRGLDGAPEWPVLQSMMRGALPGIEVMDLGCGYGWFCRWAIEQGAVHAYGLDLSVRMLDQARSMTDDTRISYSQGDLNTLELAPGCYNLVFSSLALHYVEDLTRLMHTIASGLEDGGALVFSVEHPIYSAPLQQQFVDLPDDRRVWPLEGYLHESERRTTWLGAEVVKYHRTVATYVNAVLDAGLTLDHLSEFGETANPDDSHRPWFLLLGASKPVN